MKKVNQKDFADVLAAMSGKIKKENIELYKQLLKRDNYPQFKDGEDLHLFLIYPFNKFFDGFVRAKITDNNDLVFILRQYDFIESHFKRLIKDNEGYACSADKSRTIMRALVNYYSEGKEIVFDYTQEYTYHLPQKIFNTQAAILEFYEALRILYGGNPAKYLTALKNIMDTKTAE